MSLDSVDLPQGPAGLSFRPVRDLTHEDIWRLVNSLTQSSGGLDIAQNFNIRVFNVAALRGCGGISNKLTRENVAKRSILTITNTDNLCFPRSLVAAQIYHERGTLRTWKLHDRWNAVRRYGELDVTARSRTGFDETGWRHRTTGGMWDSGNCMFPAFSRRIQHRNRSV